MASNLYYLSLGLGIWFLAVGITKVVPIEPAFGTQVSNFNKFVGAFPFQSYTGYRPTAEMYRTVTGVMEVAFGVLLAFGNYKWHRISSFGLLVVSVMSVYTLLAIGDPPQQVVLPAIFSVLLLLLISRERHYNNY